MSSVLPDASPYCPFETRVLSYVFTYDLHKKILDFLRTSWYKSTNFSYAPGVGHSCGKGVIRKSVLGFCSLSNHKPLGKRRI